MTAAEIEARIIEIVERAEFSGRNTGVAIRTRSNREAKACHEAADISIRLARMEAHKLAVDLAAEFDRQVSR